MIGAYLRLSLINRLKIKFRHERVRRNANLKIITYINKLYSMIDTKDT